MCIPISDVKDLYGIKPKFIETTVKCNSKDVIDLLGPLTPIPPEQQSPLNQYASIVTNTIIK